VTPRDQYYRELEIGLRSLLASTSDMVDESDVANIEMLVNHAEYGEALLWLCGALAELNALVPPSVTAEILRLGSAMDIVDDLPGGTWSDPPPAR
jgi:hypothetical protein